MTSVLAIFVSGVVFALGLGLAGMTRPEKVFAFLDLFGRWDPSLAFVMGGAIAVHALAVRWALGRPAPVFAERYSFSTRTGIDGRLVGGSALFGVGWGLAGYCPGPAITSLASLELAPIVIVASMTAGMLLADAWLAAEPRSETPLATAPAATDG